MNSLMIEWLEWRSHTNADGVRLWLAGLSPAKRAALADFILRQPEFREARALSDYLASPCIGFDEYCLNYGVEGVF